MKILESAKPIIVVCTTDRALAVEFYRDTLAVFEAGATTIRIATVSGFTSHEHTILGFLVSDVPGTVEALTAAGVNFLRFPGFPHDERGILSLPNNKGRVAWPKDPDGNILSITDAE